MNARDVYFVGDPGSPPDFKVFDTATGKYIEDIAEVRLTVVAGAQSTATLYFFGPTMPEQVNVVPAPTTPRPKFTKAKHSEAEFVPEDTPLTTGNVCPECSGTGEWTSPMNHKRSPCSRGCKKP